MYSVDMSKFGIKEGERYSFNKALRNFYRRVLYSKGQYDAFILTLNNIMANGTNKKTAFKILTEYIKNIIEMDTNPAQKNIVKKASESIVITYSNFNNFFDKAYEGGAKNFAYYIELFIGYLCETSTTAKLLYKADMQTTLKDMADFRYYLHNAPRI